MGASDYALIRYTLTDTMRQPIPRRTAAKPIVPRRTRPATFSLARDGMRLIPYIKAAQAVKSDIRFWASPWTPPVDEDRLQDEQRCGSSQAARKPSYFDGGNMKNDAADLAAYAQYFTKFVQGYKAQGINIEIVSPQNEPGYDQNYPSCLWDGATYTTFIANTSARPCRPSTSKVMLGTLSNAQ